MEYKITASIVIAYLIIIWINSPYGFFRAFSRDDTDSEDEKSGLAIYTDHATGVQYVGTALGGLTVRVDADGKPMTVKTKQ